MSMGQLRRRPGASWFPADDRGLGVAGLVIGAIGFLITASQATASTVLIPGSDHLVIRGTFYPRVVSLLIMVTSALLIVIESIRLKRGGNPERWMLTTLPRRVALGSLGILGSVMIAVVVMHYLGFLVAATVLATLLARWFGAPSWLKAALTGVIGTAAIFYLFTLAFGVPLPMFR